MLQPVSRRDFLRTGATGMLAATTVPHFIDVRNFDAVGDGKKNCTAAIQKALNKAAASNATVYIPPGVFACSTLKIPPHVGLCGDPTWGYGHSAGSVLRLGDPAARCLLDIKGAVGFRLNGVSLDGADLGKEIHGILLDKTDYTGEDTICIERCRICNFTGDGVRLSRIWVYSIRNCMIGYNKGHGLWFRGWDGFVVDTWFSGNGQAGIGSYFENSSCTFTANRIEWNLYGIVLRSGHAYNITGNYFDRTNGPAIALLPRGNQQAGKFITITGNLIYRSGAPHAGPFTDPLQSSHVRFEKVEGLTFVGNTFEVGQDDRGEGVFTPDYSMVLKALTNSVIANNVMNNACLKQLIVDQGGHGEGFILKDNPGSLYKHA